MLKELKLMLKELKLAIFYVKKQKSIIKKLCI